MNNLPPSTPFSDSGLNTADSNPGFLGFVRSLIHDYLSDEPPRVPSSSKDAWVTALGGLTDNILGPFPSPDTASWNLIEEKILLLDAGLEVILRVFLRVEGIYTNSESFIRRMFTRLLDICRVLEVWTEVDVDNGGELFTPTHLKDKAFGTLVTLLRGLDNSPVHSEQQEPSWNTLRSILNEVLDISFELIAPDAALMNITIISFFSKPRIVRLQETPVEPKDSALNISVAPFARIPSFLSVIFHILLQTLYPPLKCQWFLADIIRRVGTFSQDFLFYCFGPACSTTPTIRSKTITNLISSTKLLRGLKEFSANATNVPECLLQIRLESDLKFEWDPVDNHLADFFKQEEPTSGPRALITSVIHRLQMHNWLPTENGLRSLLLSYLTNTLPRMDADLLVKVQETMERADDGPERNALLTYIHALCDESLISTKPKAINGHLILSPHVWRQRVRDAVQAIISPDVLSWMDDDDASSESHICQRSLYEIKFRFYKRPLNCSPQSRVALVEKMEGLPCLLALCDQTACLNQTTNINSLELAPYLPLISELLNGSEEQVTSDVRRRVYLALCAIYKHHRGTEQLSSFVDVTFRGLNDVDRSVRVNAGHAMSALVRNCGQHEGFRHTQPIFDRLYECFEMSKNPVRETLLIAVGSMGRTSNPDVLGQVLCLLIAQLGRQNPVIKGAACMNILSLARYFQKAPYSLILPYLDQIAPFIIKRLPTQPDLLGEACRVMSIAPADFIVITLPRTLPSVFAECDRRVLDSITHELSTKASSLFIKHSHNILAYIFRLPDQSSTTKALNFVIQVLTEATSSSLDVQTSITDSSIDILSVVKSCLVPMLAELVVVMGDERVEVAEQGIIALNRVKNIVLSNKRGGTLTNLGTFLKTYMLGLISEVNEMLQDVQGKKTVAIKRKILRSLGALVEQPDITINNVAPQIMATFQTMVSIPELSEVTLESWYKFLTTLGTAELGPHVGPTSAAIVASWPIFSERARIAAFQALEYIVFTLGPELQQHLEEIVDLSVIEELEPLYFRLKTLRGRSSSEQELQRILNQSSSDNPTVTTQALRELKSFMMKDHKDYIRQITSGDIFNPRVGQILASLFTTACRDNGDGSEGIRLLSFECIGVLGAVDPDRCEIAYRNTNMVVMKNFMDEGESMVFALHLIQDLLVGAFRSTSDIKYQSHLAYSIQELLKFCQFTPALVTTSGTSVSIKARNRWRSLPKHVLETVTPLLEGRFKLTNSSNANIHHPIYPTQSTYREWIQLWTTHLITRASGDTAQRIFGVFRSAVRNKDVVVAHHILPHLVLNILISGNDDDAVSVRTEILTVLEDQVDLESNSTSDKKLLSAQAVFMLLDHLNKWVRVVRQELSSKRIDSKRARPDRANVQVEEQLLRLDSILSNIDQSLMAKAAFQCKAFARSLMNFEQQIVTLRERAVGQNDLSEYYEKLHEIYAHLDEPDGMEGVSTLILAPSLEHQIRQHESTGRWTSAQSCWELRLQESPDSVDFHLGLLRCLRNLGHYDTLRTHVAGVLTRHPDWETTLAPFQAESAWMVGAWDDVQRLVERIDSQSSSMIMARILLAMRTGNATSIAESVSQARSILGAPITAAGVKGYRRSYEAVLDLHLIHELELIYSATCSLPPGSQDSMRQERRRAIAELSKTLSSRLNITLPTFRSREPLLSMRRTAFSLSKNPRLGLGREIGKSWLASAKIARKAKQWQTAYSAVLQAQQSKASYSFIESAKLLKTSGEPLRALNELENSIKHLGLFDNQVLDLTAEPDSNRMKAKIQLLRARWMNESDRFDLTAIFKIFQEATSLQDSWESAHYYVGQFHDECFKALSSSEQSKRGLKMNMYTIRSFSRAILHGSKFVYQTVPRMLTIWLDLGEDKNLCSSDPFRKMTADISRAMKDAPVYKWFTAFPQIVSRVAHENPEVYKILSRLIITVMGAYPNQALWLFTSVVESTKSNRKTRGKIILDQLGSNPHNLQSQVATLINQSQDMTKELLALCDRFVDENKTTLSMSKDFPRLKALGVSSLIIPLQESLTASLPPASSSESTHQPFPLDVPTFNGFADEIDVMRSLAKPRKITIQGSNGQIYMFLGKPKDDLRKDARLMDLNAIINKLLKGNSESRRRQLHIRTYGVVALNEECGFIQWVPNTIPIRPVLVKYYEARRVKSWSGELADVFKRIKEANDQDAAMLFQTKVLSVFKPVFHEWFIETFPEPTAWLASRLTYGRTAAVMSIVGFILGLGDRHCENILLDTNSGDVVHVDFNCLFEKGKTLDTPERVPFRLTQNLIDGLGVSGVEGVFRISCEVTLQLLRDNKDSLMSVLDAFVHDPLVEWEDEKRKLDRDTSRKGHGTTSSSLGTKMDTRALAKSALNPIERKLKGIYSPKNSPNHARERHEKEVSTSSLVQMLIQEATDFSNLAKMYPGWAPWH